MLVAGPLPFLRKLFSSGDGRASAYPLLPSEWLDSVTLVACSRGRMQSMQAARAVVYLPECQSIACMEFLYVLMRKCQAITGLAIYNARPIGGVSKLSSL